MISDKMIARGTQHTNFNRGRTSSRNTCDSGFVKNTELVISLLLKMAMQNFFENKHFNLSDEVTTYFWFINTPLSLACRRYL